MDLRDANEKQLFRVNRKYADTAICECLIGRGLDRILTAD